MNQILMSLEGVPHFTLYFAVSLVYLIIFKFLYTKATPHDEWILVKDGQNQAAALGLAGAIIGFGIALSSSMKVSESLVDFTIWGAIALVAQIIAFVVVRFTFLPKITERIENDEKSAGYLLGGTSIAVGLLNAASMSY